MTHAMSALAQATACATPPRQDGIPPVVETANSPASALTSDPHHVILEERNKNDRERLACQKQIADLQRTVATVSMSDTGVSQFSTPPSQCQGLPTERVTQKDSNGNKWFQVIHCCPKCGCNCSHSNERCRNKGEGNWVSGAAATDHKGGSNKNEEHQSPHGRVAVCCNSPMTVLEGCGLSHN